MREINVYVTTTKKKKEEEEEEFVENRKKFILTLQSLKIQTRIVQLSLNVWLEKIPAYQLG